MKNSRRKFIAIVTGIILTVALLFIFQKSRDVIPATMQTASDLLTVQQAMNKQGLSGFLPGNHSRLNNRLRQQKFTGVTVMPRMVTGAHAADLVGLRFGTSIVLLKNDDTNSWTVWRDVYVGSRYWKSKIGTLNE